LRPAATYWPIHAGALRAVSAGGGAGALPPHRTRAAPLELFMSEHRLFRSAAGVAALALGVGGLAACGGGGTTPPAPAAARPSQLTVPVDYYTLANGLRVVLSRDTTAPTAGVGVYYHIGFRNEPRDRTGFSHLFEHLMFQGSRNLGKLQFIRLVESNGGVLDGSTRFDFTNYYQVVPSQTLETMLWAEADRMKGLAIDAANLRNQQDVVKNEVKVNVLNQPYGSFPWIDLPMAANTNWYNAHNFYGDLKDLDAATLADATAFSRTYYAPNNAALAIVGDFDPAQARAWVTKYFGGIPRVAQPPRPDLSEPRQTQERKGSRVDAFANRPALGVAYHMPDRWTQDWYAMGLIDQILGQGRDARLYQALVQEAGLTSDVQAGINWGLGNMFDYEGPMLWMVALYHDKDKPAEALISVFDREVEALRAAPVDAATLDRAKVKMRSSLYDAIEEFSGLGKLNLLASFALFDNDPNRINTLEGEFARITPDAIRKTAQEYLRRENRTVFAVIPGAKEGAGGSSR
jgi:predicted Zn-dependent peptidase